MNMYKQLFFGIICVSYTCAIERITVIGIGRLGLCTALCFEKAGYSVMGVDVNQPYVDSINNKTLQSSEPFLQEYLAASKNFIATTSLDEGLQFSDIYFVVIDTPSASTPEAYDHSKLSKLLFEINKRKVHNKHLVISCTIFPGYIQQKATYLLRDCINTTISYNPEFIAQGAIIQGLQNADMVLIGEGSAQAGDMIEKIHHTVTNSRAQICRMSPASAEITKLALNCFITTKIAYANAIGDIADKTPGADKYAILAAIGKDSRIGSKCLQPGYGFGGPCFPRDNRALGSYARSLGLQPIMQEATDAANKLHADTQAESFMYTKQAEYTFDDVAYKSNCPVVIIEESQKLAVAEKLARAGKKVTIRDRADIIAAVQQAYGSLFKYEVEV